MAWAVVHESDGKPMVCGDYDQEQLTVYGKRPKTDMLDERVIRVRISEPPRRTRKGGRTAR